MIRRDEVYKIGKLGKPHGVKGEITFAITDDVFDRVDAEYLYLFIWRNIGLRTMIMCS